MRPWIAASLIAALAGCKGKGKQQAAPRPLPPPVDARPPAAAVADEDAPPPPTTPPPGMRGVQIIDLTYGGHREPGLPAIRDDGSAVAATAEADDGGRGYLNLRFLVIDGATSKVTTSIVLADANESSAAEAADDRAGNMVEEDALATRVRERVAQANALVAGAGWRALEPIEREDSGPPRPSESLSTGDALYTYDLARRRLTVSRGGKQVAVHDLARLVPKPTTRTDTHCPGDLAYLGALDVDRPGNKVVVRLDAWPQGGEECGAGEPIYAVVPLPP